MAFAVLHHGKWCVDFTTPDGNRKRKIVGDGSNEAAAEAEAAIIDEQIKQVRAETTTPTALASVDQVVETWFEEHQKHISPETQERYAVYCRHWKRIFRKLGQSRFYMLDETAIEKYMGARLMEAGRRTVFGEMTALRQLCAWAVRRGYATKDWSRDVKKPKFKKPLPYAFSPVHQKLIIEACSSDRRLRLMILLALQAGLRREGVCGLRVDDVDIPQENIRVCEKGEKERILDIHPDLRRAIEECPPVDKVYWFGADQTSDRGMEDFSTAMCSFLRRVTGLDRKRARFHNLRHTFAVNLLRAGVDVRLVRDLLGHESLATTMLYLSVMDSERGVAISKLPSVLPPS